MTFSTDSTNFTASRDRSTGFRNDQDRAIAQKDRRQLQKDSHRAKGCLTPREIIPDSALRRLAHNCPTRATGRLSEIDTAALAMILPDLCGEMITLRAACNTPKTTYAVSNDVLRQMHQDSPRRHLGELTDREHLILSARLTSMCRELITLRSVEVMANASGQPHQEPYAQLRPVCSRPQQGLRLVLPSVRFERHQVCTLFSIPESHVHLLKPSQCEDRTCTRSDT